MKILILTSFRPHSIYVVNRIVKEKNVIARVVENKALLKKKPGAGRLLWGTGFICSPAGT